MRLTSRWRAFAAVAALVAACGPSGSSGGPTAGASVRGSPAATTLPPETPAIFVSPTSLITAGTLVDCVDIEFPPMEFFPDAGTTDPDRAIGFDVDAARAVADLLGVELEIRNTAIDTLMPDLEAGRCDIVWSALDASEARLQVADAVRYMATGEVIMVKVGNEAGIGSPADLCGRTISIQSGGLVELRARDASEACEAAGAESITIEAYKLVADELQQVADDRVDAVWETDGAVSAWMLDHPGEYEVAFAFPREDVYSIYFGKGMTDIGAALGDALAALRDDGTLIAIARRYQIDPATLDAIGTGT